ncbi:hypothetical protein AN958_11089 [Leucoagaricus sp. SymC.cos]|nr:hypothetical protein AN958_11089 [Leucoagaricus sp. SymC.cos]
MDIRRVYLGAVIFSYLAYEGVSKSLDVVWISPVEGTSFSAGNTIVAKWTSSSPLVSPDFKLCVVAGRKDGGEDNEENGKCGAAIWPKVQEAVDGYMVTITAPEVAEASKYCLEMHDDFGNLFTSPVFALGGASNSAKVVASGSSATDVSGPVITSASSMGASGTSKASVESGSRSVAHGGTSSSSFAPNSSASLPPLFGFPVSSAQPLPSTQPGILVSRRPVSTAAVAVPLSVVSGIILVAGLLCYRARRELAKDRKRELKSLVLSQKDQDRDGYGSVGEVQRAMSVLSRKGFGAYSNTPDDTIPHFVAIKPEPRAVTRDPYTPIVSSVSSHSVYDHLVPAFPYAGTDTVRGKSLTAQYTASGTVPLQGTTSAPNLSFSNSMPDIPPNLLPARMLPLHVRSETPGGDRPMPMPPEPIHCLSPSGSTNVYEAIAAKLKGYQ